MSEVEVLIGYLDGETANSDLEIDGGGTRVLVVVGIGTGH